MDPSLLFSANRKIQPSREQGRVILASDSEEEVKPKLSPARLSFEDSSRADDTSFLGRHEVTLHSSSESDDENGEKRKGLETAIVEEWESKESDHSSIKSSPVNASRKGKTKKARKRIVSFSSSSEEEEKEGNDCSFDIGAIKRQYATPKPRHHHLKIENESHEENDYDLQDSFINNESLSLSEEDTSKSEDEPDSSFETEKTPIESEDETTNVKTPKRKEKQLMKTIETKTFLDSLGDVEPSPQTHPDAIQYLKDYSRHKCELADFLFKLFNEQIFNGCLPNNMPLVWSKTLNKTAGRCFMLKGSGMEDRKCKIELASKVLTSADRLRDTLIHEMCHAACWLLNSVKNGHGHLWQSWAKLAMLKYPELPIISRCHNYMIETKFAYVCTDCNHHYKRHSKSINTEEKRCGKCKGHLKLYIWNKKLNRYVQYIDEDGGGKTNKFAAFVKENYKFSRTPGKTHSEAMKELGKLFAEAKLDKP